MFDCVLPTRLARHGTILTSEGRLNLRNARFARDPEPLEPGCACSTCQRWSRAYLKHLLAVSEPTGARLTTIHNVHWLLRLIDDVRSAIGRGTYGALRRQVAEVWDERVT
jgi:queuine tRNA-ribosyltransferase